MLHIERYINELMPSNCYIVWDDVTRVAICIDPASEFSIREIDFIKKKRLYLNYIILTHEHTDHTWGVNALVNEFDAKVICSEMCKENLPKATSSYFRLYLNRENYSYNVKRVDYTTESLDQRFGWGNYIIKFVPSPGHSPGSICIEIDGSLFTGDTIMQYKAYINKRNGDLELYKQSIQHIVDTYAPETRVYPGHGEPFLLKDKDNIIEGIAKL